VTRLGEFSASFLNYRSSPFFGDTELCRYVIISTKNGLGYVLGVFFTTLSGRPVARQCTNVFHTLFRECCCIRQGDQIGRLFAPSDIFAFGLIYQNYINGQNIWAFFSHWNSHDAKFDWVWFGIQFGRFFHESIWSPWFTTKKTNVKSTCLEAILSQFSHLNFRCLVFTHTIWLWQHSCWK
jgi:hypothetical protein